MRTVFKPAGLPVFPPDEPQGDCVVARLWAADPWRRTTAWPPGFTGGVAHRIDTSTSGALLVADSPDELMWLRRWFKEGRLQRYYVLRVSRLPAWAEATCALPVALDRSDRARVVVQKKPGQPHRGEWMPASTTFRQLAGDVFEARTTSLVMHQLRVHAAHLGVPLLGDTLYGGGELPADAPTGLGFYLHHVGLTGPGGMRTDPVPVPEWAAGLVSWPP